jgi:hypothetical protein
MLVAINRRDITRLELILDEHIGRTQGTYEIGIEDIAAADAMASTNSAKVVHDKVHPLIRILPSSKYLPV